ncbi:hypothetical protein [Metallosphaera hakonensis]|uniref:DUF4352 domain-containing protein n=1 Tax=Metallosphaera hakonensis JCM 8857 = DSM 7519 TaxID=1293036 RepID=A0A2U9IRD5_9CREN|nr:hypothetical protein [Metallosphaera hakonensis]AWR98575.1 hypothetical protein DFR87_01385 [Metallosphaera hakonensis JCM 8857 = DSM 7519]
MKLGRRYLKSKRAISGAVTALILVIVSVALALAVAVFAFGLFGSFGSSGNLQVVGTTYLNYLGNSMVQVTMTVKNPSSNPASINAITIGNYTASQATNGKVNSGGEFNVSTGSNQIPAGFSGQIIIYVDNGTPIAGLTQANVGGTIPVSISITEGTLSPTLTINAVLQKLA